MSVGRRVNGVVQPPPPLPPQNRAGGRDTATSNGPGPGRYGGHVGGPPMRPPVRPPSSDHAAGASNGLPTRPASSRTRAPRPPTDTSSRPLPTPPGPPRMPPPPSTRPPPPQRTVSQVNGPPIPPPPLHRAPPPGGSQRGGPRGSGGTWGRSTAPAPPPPPSRTSGLNYSIGYSVGTYRRLCGWENLMAAGQLRWTWAEVREVSGNRSSQQKLFIADFIFAAKIIK